MGAYTLILKAVRVNMVIQIRIGDTRRVFFMNPPGSFEDLRKTTFCVRF